ncbi:hypothetical protein PRN20_03345 [Devosia sp. ZB163]|uniref:hypothetical protein n=1 Tax=Devosia sp. ZB163 TaxID=3025938 RepID=UPI00235F4963|nr:hypothetical protein [Devosia sp. ZB163]MDC9822759.1 hypothetical protein [Devosia sp. ZB163]
MKDFSTSSSGEELLFDWQLDVSRLEKEAFDAKQNKIADPWALVEAECSLDLVDAEIAAIRGSSPSEARTKILAHLEAWRLRLERVVRNLRSLSSDVG